VVRKTGPSRIPEEERTECVGDTWPWLSRRPSCPPCGPDRSALCERSSPIPLPGGPPFPGHGEVMPSQLASNSSTRIIMRAAIYWRVRPEHASMVALAGGAGRADGRDGSCLTGPGSPTNITVPYASKLLRSFLKSTFQHQSISIIGSSSSARCWKVPPRVKAEITSSSSSDHHLLSQ